MTNRVKLRDLQDIATKRENSAEIARNLAKNISVMRRLAEIPEARLCTIYGNNTGLPLRAGWALNGRNVPNLNGDPVWDKLRTGKFYIGGSDAEEFTDSYWENFYDGDFRYTATESMDWHKPSHVVFIYKMLDRTMTEQEYLHILNTPEEELRREWQDARKVK